MPGIQRYRCQATAAILPPPQGLATRKPTQALAILLYSFGKASFRWLGKLFNVSAVNAYKRVCQAPEALPGSEVREEIREMELDKLWHFLQEKTNVGFGNPMIVANGAVSPVVGRCDHATIWATLGAHRSSRMHLLHR